METDVRNNLMGGIYISFPAGVKYFQWHFNCMSFQNNVSEQWNIGLVWKKKGIFRVTFTIYWQGMFHSLVAMALILRTWTLFFSHQPNAGTLYYMRSQHAALFCPNLIYLNSVACHVRTAERSTLLPDEPGCIFHNKPSILNIWTRTSDANVRRFPQTVSQTCNYWRIKCSMCGRYCSNRAAAVFWNECTWWVSFCVRAWLQCWVIQGIKRADFHRRLQEWWENSHVCGSRSDSSPLQVKTQELLRWRNVRRRYFTSWAQWFLFRDAGFMPALPTDKWKREREAERRVLFY